MISEERIFTATTLFNHAIQGNTYPIINGVSSFIKNGERKVHRNRPDHCPLKTQEEIEMGVIETNCSFAEPKVPPPPEPLRGERVPVNSNLEPSWFERSANAANAINQHDDEENFPGEEEEEEINPLNEQIDPDGDVRMEDFAHHLDYLVIGMASPLATFAIRQATHVSVKN